MNACDPPSPPSAAGAVVPSWLAALAPFAQAVEDGMFVATPDRRHFHFISPRAMDIWGVTAAQLARSPRCFQERVVPEDLHIYQDRAGPEQRGEPVDVTFRIRHDAHGVRWLRSRTRLQAVSDGRLCVYGLITDVTADRERELELQRARDVAEAASRAKSDFLATMSHEIRTPMNGILGMTELLLGTSLSDQQRRFAQAVYRSGESLLEIINDILDFSVIESGRMALSAAPFALRAVVEDTLEVLAPRAHDKRVSLVLQEQPGLPQRIHGDALRLRQVLANLVANAIKFTEVGQVTVELRMEPSPDSSTRDDVGPWLAIEVRDTGIGIPPELMPGLFEAFTQAQRGPDRRYGGLGLGLAISRRLVDLMGGRLTAVSHPGAGSSFTVALPLGDLAEVDAAAEGTDDPPPEPVSMPGFRQPPRILVVEDNVVNQEVVARMLRTLGCRVRVACSAAEGLRALSEARFELVLMDIQMPGMDGVAALRRFRSGAAGRELFVTPLETPVIAVTANALEGDEDRFLGLGFDDYLSKPFRQSQLHTMLKRRLSSAAFAPHDAAGTAGGPADAMNASGSDAWAALFAALDGEALARLKELDPTGASGLLRRVLSAFETSLQRLLLQLQDARRQGDHAGLRHVAHTLKSSSASVGALELSRLCADVERRIRQDDTDDLDPLLDGMVTESGRLLAVLTPALRA